MKQSIVRLLVGLWFYLMILPIVKCSHEQIYYKTIEDSLNLTYDPKNHIYPVIEVPTSCTTIPLSSCKINGKYWQLFEDACHISNYCPNGTRAQCVENRKDHRLEHLLLVCAPTGNCKIDARNIIHFDEKKPDRYELGEKKCQDGFHHLRSVSCFGKCERDNSIVVHQEATLKSRAIVYCNYIHGFCNPEKPKLFELTRGPNVCTSWYGRKLCPYGTDILPDCSCKEACPDKLSHRDPYSDFKCRRKKLTILMSSTNSKLLRVNAQLRPHHTGLRFSYSFASAIDILVKRIEIVYSEVGSPSEEVLPDIVVSDDGSPRHIDVESVNAGQTYLFTITLFYEHAGKMKNYTISEIGTVPPKTVTNLRSNFNSSKKSIELSWMTPSSSKQDRYRVDYRMVRRNRKPAWFHNVTQECNIEIVKVFPGEEYEARVYSVSDGTDSLGRTTSLIIPPLPPKELSVHFPSLSSINVNVIWFTYDTLSHVEYCCLTYNRSGGDSGSLDVPYPDHSGQVTASLNDVHTGHIYTVLVYSVVGDVFSTFPAHKDFDIPAADKKSGTTGMSKGMIGIGVVCVLVLILVILLVVLFVFRRVAVIRELSNTLRIEQLVANFFGSSEVNINLENNAEIPFNIEAQEGNSESDDDKS